MYIGVCFEDLPSNIFKQLDAVDFLANYYNLASEINFLDNPKIIAQENYLLFNISKDGSLLDLFQNFDVIESAFYEIQNFFEDNFELEIPEECICIFIRSKQAFIKII